MFDSDAPISKASDDKLGRAKFAEALGEAIRRQSSQDSLVVGLYGPWGSGKTSVINMMVDHLEKSNQQEDTTTQVLPIHFNPWLHSTTRELVGQFFDELAVALGQSDLAGDLQSAGKQIEAYAKMIRPFTLVPGLKEFASALQQVLESAGGAIQSAGGQQKTDLAGMKRRLSETLSNQPTKLLIIIDDIDRLSTEEIRQIFQLTKAVADFKNTVYLLSFDRERIEQALEEDGGPDYLGKIVQVPFDLPATSGDALRELLFGRIGEILTEDVMKRWDRATWGMILGHRLLAPFSTLRSVTRFCNVLAFDAELIAKDVDPVDFVTMTALKVFCPQLHGEIQRRKYIFVGKAPAEPTRSEDLMTAFESDEAAGEIVSCIEAQIEGPWRGRDLNGFLSYLFPNVRKATDTVVVRSERSSSRALQGRVCHPATFDLFFLLCPGPSAITRTELELLLKLSHQSEEFERGIREFLGADRGVSLLFTLAEIVQDLPEDAIQPFVRTLFDVGDDFPSLGDEHFLQNTPTMLSGICVRALSQLDVEGHRYTVLKNILEAKPKGIVLPLDLYWTIKRQFETDSPDLQEPIVSEWQLSELRTLVSENVRAVAEHRSLLHHPEVLAILYGWVQCDGLEIVAEHVQCSTQEDHELLRFLNEFCKSVEGYEALVFIPDNARDFLELGDLIERVAQCDPSNDELAAVKEAFLESANGGFPLSRLT